MGLFGDLFDFNGDGKRDSFEKAAEFGAFMQMINSEKNEDISSVGLGQMYVADERFKENIDKHAPGTAAFINEAITVYCRK